MMHIYSVEVGEGIRIGDEFTAQVVGIKGGSVRLGISAPADVPIYREELDGRPHETQLPATEAESLQELPQQVAQPKKGPKAS
jgi:carbon storage regulator